VHNFKEPLSVDDYFVYIRQLTTHAAKSLEADEIEQCQIAVEKRLTLLKKLYSIQHQSDKCLENGNAIIDEYPKLITWLNSVDSKVMDKLTKLRDSAESKTLKQVKTKHALKQYQAFYR